MTPEQLRSFKCLRCGACCRLKGIVRVSPEECDAIADFLGVPHGLFIENFTRLTDDRRSLTLIDQENGACFFYDMASRGCRINPVKPRQCSTFPLQWRNPGWETNCQGAIAIRQQQPPEEE